jgi:hypothetical protein
MATHWMLFCLSPQCIHTYMHRSLSTIKIHCCMYTWHAHALFLHTWLYIILVDSSVHMHAVELGCYVSTLNWGIRQDLYSLSEASAWVTL